MNLSLSNEHVQLWTSHLKSITTLSSGLIVAIIAIIELTKSKPECVALAAVSLALFLFSIIGSVLAQMILINVKVLNKEELKPSIKRTLVQSLFVANIGFLIAVLLLTIFGVVNVV